MTESFETVQIERHGAVARLVLNRPDALNSFNTQLRTELRRAVEAINADESLRVVVLAGAGRAFSAGADLAEGALGSAGGAVGATTENQLNFEYKPIIVGISESPKLWIAEVQGAAAGIGSAVAMACDFMVMADEGYLYQAFAAIGLIPDGGATWQLLRAVGRKRALEIIVGGERIYAQRCLELGLCNRVVAAQALPAATMDWAAELAGKAPLAMTYSKLALARADALSLEAMVSAEAGMQHILIESEDCSEGISAFFEKRSPQFSGR
jgi:2-(1,2-epoxy-1,2-dihydrophenyl)acetyl-CoA isomerase